MKIKQNTMLSYAALVNGNEEVEFEFISDIKFKELIAIESVPDYVKKWEKFEFKLVHHEMEPLDNNSGMLTCIYVHEGESLSSTFNTTKRVSKKEYFDFVYMDIINNHSHCYYPSVGEFYHIIDNKIVATTKRGYHALKRIFTKKFYKKHLTYDLSLPRSLNVNEGDRVTMTVNGNVHSEQRY